MKEKLRFLGLDVHAETIAAAIAEPDGEVALVESLCWGPLSNASSFMPESPFHFSGRRLDMNNDVRLAAGGSMFASTITT
jgi:hypothetical protein